MPANLLVSQAIWDQALLQMRQEVVNRAHEVAKSIERRVQHALAMDLHRTQTLPVELLRNYPPPSP